MTTEELAKRFHEVYFSTLYADAEVYGTDGVRRSYSSERDGWDTDSFGPEHRKATITALQALVDEELVTIKED